VITCQRPLIVHAVRRAVIPAAGRGTRLRPFSLAIPKELAPLGSTPAIHLVLDEVASAGLAEAIVVIAPGKELLRRHVELAQEAGTWPNLGVRYALQQRPTGLADALALCEPLVEGEPFAVLLPDNVPLAPDYRLDSLLGVAREPGQCAVGVIEIDRRWSGLFGNSGRIDGRPIAPGVLAVERLHDKLPGRLVLDDPGALPILRACGRYLFTSDVFALLAASRSGSTGEVDEVPAVQRLARDGRLVGVLLPMPLFDVGHPSGLVAANAHLAGLEAATPQP
jgi:UTP--glucose-1-phosphate uridylyltransferase